MAGNLTFLELASFISLQPCLPEFRISSEELSYNKEHAKDYSPLSSPEARRRSCASTAATLPGTSGESPFTQASKSKPRPKAEEPGLFARLASFFEDDEPEAEAAYEPPSQQQQRTRATLERTLKLFKRLKTQRQRSCVPSLATIFAEGLSFEEWHEVMVQDEAAMERLEGDARHSACHSAYHSACHSACHSAATVHATVTVHATEHAISLSVSHHEADMEWLEGGRYTSHAAPHHCPLPPPALSERGSVWHCLGEAG